MKQAKLVLDKRAKNKEGLYPVIISLSHGTNIRIRTGVTVREEFWYNGMIIDGPDRQINNAIITSRLNEVNQKLLELEVSGELRGMSHSDLKKYLTGKEIRLTGVKKAYIAEYYKVFRQRIAKKKTLDVYDFTISKISSYVDDINKLRFDEINRDWLLSFEKHLSTTNKINSISIHMRNIRAVFNSAIDDEVIEQNLYPFRRYKIKNEKTEKRSLTVEQLITLRDYPLSGMQGTYRDIFMLMFYLVGINFIDLFNAQQSDIVNGRLNYRRSKTSALFSIKLEPEALSIIEKHKGQKRLISWFEVRGDHDQALKQLNKELKKIGPTTIGKRGKKTITPLFPYLSTYWTRHTWATIASDLDIPKEIIANALGHGSNSVTDIYINFNRNKIDQANRQVLDHIKIPLKP